MLTILKNIKKEILTAITLNDLFKKYHVQTLDLLHTDVEGHDYQIIKQIDFARIRPSIIFAEYKHLSYWETFKLVSKLRKYYKIFRTNDDILAVETSFARSLSGVV